MLESGDDNETVFLLFAPSQVQIQHGASLSVFWTSLQKLFHRREFRSTSSVGRTQWTYPVDDQAFANHPTCLFESSPSSLQPPPINDAVLSPSHEKEIGSLGIRLTINQARIYPDAATWVVIRQLIWPLNLWYFTLPEALPYQKLQESPELIDARQPGIHQLMEIPLFCARDTPLRSLYRMYDELCAGQLILMFYECDYLFRHGSARWRLSRMPGPSDDDTVRLAILASLVEALVDAFKWKMELGIRRGKGNPIDRSADRATTFAREKPPRWTSHVAAVVTPVNLIDRSKEPYANPEKKFSKGNMEAGIGYLCTA